MIQCNANNNKECPVKKILPAALFAFAVAASNLAHAVPSLTFVIDGDTFGAPYSFTNTSTGGEKIDRFVFDLSTIGADYCFDTVDGNLCNDSIGLAFTPNAASKAATGLYAPATVADGSKLLDLRFNDFNVGETFTWQIDVDRVNTSTVYGSDLIGATITAYFSNGLTALGKLQGVQGNSDAAALTITAVVPTTDVPEPATMSLMALAGAALLYRRRKK